MIRKLLIGLALALGLATMLAGPAYAADEHDVGITPSAWTLVVDAGAWQAINLLVVPIVVGLLTKAATTAKRKVLVMGIVSGISSLAAVAVVSPEGVATFSSSTVTMWVVSAVIAITGHYGIYKPIGVTGSEPTSGLMLPAHGL